MLPIQFLVMHDFSRWEYECANYNGKCLSIVGGVRKIMRLTLRILVVLVLKAQPRPGMSPRKGTFVSESSSLSLMSPPITTVSPSLTTTGGPDEPAAATAGCAAHARGAPINELADAVRNRRRDDTNSLLRPGEVCEVHSAFMVPPLRIEVLVGIVHR